MAKVTQLSKSLGQGHSAIKVTWPRSHSYHVVECKPLSVYSAKKKISRKRSPGFGEGHIIVCTQHTPPQRPGFLMEDHQSARPGEPAKNVPSRFLCVAIRWFCFCFLLLREYTSWLSSPKTFHTLNCPRSIQDPLHSPNSGPQRDNRQQGPVQGEALFPHPAGSSLFWPPTSPSQAASDGCFKTFSIRCVLQGEAGAAHRARHWFPLPPWTGW